MMVGGERNLNSSKEQGEILFMDQSLSSDMFKLNEKKMNVRKPQVNKRSLERLLKTSINDAITPWTLERSFIQQNILKKSQRREKPGNSTLAANRQTSNLNISRNRGIEPEVN